MNADRCADSFLLIVLKKHGIIQGKIWTATEKLDPLLEASQKELEKEAVKESMGKKGRRWRYDPKLYHSDHRTSLNFGAVNLSPAWFELGHEVSASACKTFYPLTAHSEREVDARIPTGCQDFRIQGCFVLARFHRGIKFDFECDLGGDSSGTIRSGSGDPQAPEEFSRDPPSGCAQPVDIRIQRGCCNIAT